MFNYIPLNPESLEPLTIDFNPRVVQFVMHYVKGTQEDMTLTEREVLATKYQILMSMCKENGMNKTTYSDDYWIGENAYCVEMATQEGIDLLTDYPAYAYLKSITMGLVGGFDYTIKPNMMAMCVDTWDFNVGFDFELSLNVPRKLYRAFQALTRKLDLEWYVIELPNGDYNVTIQEQDLTHLNETHAFDTVWAIDFDGESCCIDKNDYLEYLESLRQDVLDW